ncbi:MAG: HEAT repeat domain-containing protein [Terriglobia bacterium]
MNCNEVDLSLYLYGELGISEREALEAHLSGCSGCQAALERARRLQSLMSSRLILDPNPALLVQCRQTLEASLDREQYGWRRLFADAYAAISNPSRVAAALTLVVFGFGLGWTIRPRAGRIGQVASRSAPGLQVESSVAPDFGTMGSISQVSQDPETDKVRITVNSEHRVTLEGSLNDPRIRKILVDAVKTYSNPGIRLDTLDALRQKSDNPSVEDALLYALRRDPNAGVRLEALRSVPAMSWDSKVQNALVEAVQQDTNPGVRVEAIDDLVKHALAGHDQALLPVFQDFAKNASNAYVRVKALAAARELEQAR